jgi:hypothetical protein
MRRMRCREAMTAFEAHLDARRPITDSPELTEHLRVCSRCASEVAELQALSRLAATLALDPTTSVDAVKRRVMSALTAERSAPRPTRFPLRPALTGALASAAVICVFALGIFVGKGAMGPREAAPEAAVVAEAPAVGMPSIASPDAPVFTMGSGDSGGQIAEPIVEAPQTAKPAMQTVASSSSARNQVRRAASSRKPVIPRGDSVRRAGERAPHYTTTHAPAPPEPSDRPSDGVRVRSYELEMPELDMPTPSPPSIVGAPWDGGGTGAGGRIIVIVPGQEF